MSYSLLWHAVAKTDYGEAYEWYESRKDEPGERFVAAVRKLMTAITLHPETYGIAVS